MTMKPHHWEPEDIRAGMVVCKPSGRKGPFKPDGWTAKWTHLIGFVPGDGGDSTGHYCHIALCDGMVYWRCMTKARMAEEMNEQGMIPMPRAWVMATMRYLHPAKRRR